MMNHNQGIAVLAFQVCAGGCPIFKAKNTLETVIYRGHLYPRQSDLLSLPRRKHASEICAQLHIQLINL